MNETPKAAGVGLAGTLPRGRALGALVALALSQVACSDNNAPATTQVQPMEMPALMAVANAPAFTTGANGSYEFTNRGGAASRCELANGQMLPEGLSLAPAQGTCRIAGMPKADFPATRIAVVATNSAGNSLVTTTISSSTPPAPPPPPGPPPTPDPPPAQTSDTLMWADEFNGDSLNSGNWSFVTGNGCPSLCGWGNSERQSYTGDEANLRVRNGFLEIVATSSGTHSERKFKSARIRSFGKRAFRYPDNGTLRIEARMTLPGGQGLWPAFWMLPEETVHGRWPMSGEIDIVEAVNLGVDGRTTTSFSTHYGMSWPHNSHATGEYINAQSPQTDFHVFAIEWEEGEIRWYINDKHVHTQTSQHWYTLSMREPLFRILDDAEPFTHTFHLLLNVAVGGNFSGPVAAETRFPQTMRVDWVRVYSCGPDAADTRCHKDASVTAHDFTRSGTTKGNAAETITATIFNDGLQSHTDTSNSRTVEFVARPIGSGVTVDASATDGSDQVLSLSFTDTTGSAAIALGRVHTALDISGAQAHGQLEFNLKLVEHAAESGLALRIADTEGNTIASRDYTPAQLEAIKTAADSSQTQIIDLSQDSELTERVARVLTIQPTGSFAASARTTVQLDDIRLHIHCHIPRRSTPCGIDVVSDIPLSELDVTPETSAYPNTLDLYSDGLNTASGISEFFVYTPPDQGGGTVEEIDVGGDHGKVLQCSSTGEQIVCGISTPDNTTVDLSAFAGTGFVEFDIRIITPPTNSSATIDFKYEIPREYSRDIPLANATSFTSNGAWRRARVDLNNSFWRTGAGVQYDLSKVTRLLWFPSWGRAAGAVWQIDNVTLYRP